VKIRGIGRKGRVSNGWVSYCYIFIRPEVPGDEGNLWHSSLLLSPPPLLLPADY